jgi:dihydroceramidase
VASSDSRLRVPYIDALKSSRGEGPSRRRASMIAHLAGFWGMPTSTVDWCEANYAVTPFICEFFNTISSLAMIVAGGLGAFVHRRVFDRWMLAAFGCLGVVGLGSVAFHATLRFEFQLLDELPMLYLVTMMVYLLLEPGPSQRFGRWLPLALLGYACLATISDALTRGQFQFFAFQLSFGALELFCLLRVAFLSFEPANRAILPLFKGGLVLYLGGILLWFTDLRFCSWLSAGMAAAGLPNPQLHAWWHVLVSGGFYMLLLVVAYDRLRRHGSKPVLRSQWGLLPVVGVPH